MLVRLVTGIYWLSQLMSYDQLDKTHSRASFLQHSQSYITQIYGTTAQYSRGSLAYIGRI